MKKLYTFILCVGLIAPLLQSCEADAVQEDAIIQSNLTTSITNEDLIGEWILSEMQADTLVNLNDDQESNTNILLETSCFNTMGVVFDADGTFVTTNSKLDFRAGTTSDKFQCISGRQDFGTWEVEGENELVLSINIDGTIYEQRRTLERTADTFSFKVSRLESEQYYDDPGDTHASRVTILELEYTRITN